MSIKITQGTQSDIYTKTNNGTDVQVVKLDIGSGTALADWGGTVTANINTGTINVGTFNNTGTNVNIVTGSLVGTVVSNVATGTQQTLGTVGTIPGVGIVTRIGNIGTIESGTVTTTLALNTGTITTIAAGTQNTLGTVGTLIGAGTITNIGSISNIGTMPASTLVLNSGTITTIAAGTLNTLGTVGTIPGVGTITNIGALGLGTVFGPVASGGSLTKAPNVVAGTDGGGTLYAFLTDTAGHSKTDIITGTVTSVTSVGSVVGVGTISNTVTTSGTVTGVGTVTTQGTLVGQGTLTNLGSVTNIGSIAAGVITSVGTVPGVGTITNLGSITNAGTVKEVTTVPTVTTVSNLTAGSVAVTLGTVGGKAASGAAAVANPVQIAGTDSGGTIYSPLVTSAGALTVTATPIGTTIGTIVTGTLQNLVSGTINALAAGTITAGTLTNLATGTINALASGTITGGTLGNLVSGTVTTTSMPSGSAVLFSNTHGTSGAAVFGTIVSAVGAGTKIYLAGVSMIVASGTVDCGITTNVAGSTGTGVYARGNFPPGGGMDQDFIPPIQSGTNGTLCYFLNGAGTVDFQVQYWVGP